MPLLLALDPGLADFGAALLCGRTGAIVAADVLTTAPNTIPRKREQRPLKPGEKRRRTKRPVVGGVALDTDRRIAELAEWLGYFASSSPDRIGAAVAEAPGGSLLGFTAAIALGTASTVAAMFCRTIAAPLERVSVRTWRRTYVPGEKVITDDALYAAIGARAADQVARELALRGRAASKSVHALDSVGIGRWARNYSPSVRRALGIDVGGL